MAPTAGAVAARLMLAVAASYALVMADGSSPTRKPTDFPTMPAKRPGDTAQAAKEAVIIVMVIAFVGFMLGVGNKIQDSQRFQRKLKKVAFWAAPHHVRAVVGELEVRPEK